MIVKLITMSKRKTNDSSHLSNFTERRTDRDCCNYSFVSASIGRVLSHTKKRGKQLISHVSWKCTTLTQFGNVSISPYEGKRLFTKGKSHLMQTENWGSGFYLAISIKPSKSKVVLKTEHDCSIAVKLDGNQFAMMWISALWGQYSRHETYLWFMNLTFTNKHLLNLFITRVFERALMRWFNLNHLNKRLVWVVLDLWLFICTDTLIWTLWCTQTHFCVFGLQFMVYYGILNVIFILR